MTRIVLGDINIDIVHKKIKNIHLSVNPPEGYVKVTAPTHVGLDEIRAFAISKLGWIKQQRSKLQAQERETPREYLDRESHYVWGVRYLLKIVGDDRRSQIELDHSNLIMKVGGGLGTDRRQALIDAWYRQQIRIEAPPLIAKWEPQIGVKVEKLLLQKMKTKWGSCNPDRGHIRLNSELAKKPKACLEYIIVHEMVHLITRTHGERFRQLMDTLLPHWTQTRLALNRAPLAHTDWSA